MHTATASNLRPLYKSLTEALRTVAQNLQDFVSNPRAPVPEGLQECAKVAAAMGLLGTQRFCEFGAELAFELREQPSSESLRLLAAGVNAIGVHMRSLTEGSSTSYSALNKSFARLAEGLGKKYGKDELFMPVFKTLEASYGWLPPEGAGRRPLVNLLRSSMSDLATMDAQELRALLKRLESRNSSPAIKVFLDAAMCALELDEIPESALRAIGRNLTVLAAEDGGDLDVFAVSVLLKTVRDAGLSSARSMSLMRNVISEAPLSSVDTEMARKFGAGLDKFREIFKKAAGASNPEPMVEAVKQFSDSAPRLGSAVVTQLSGALHQAGVRAKSGDPEGRLWVAGAMAVIVMRHAVDLASRGLSEDSLLDACNEIAKRLADPTADPMAFLQPPPALMDQVRLGAVGSLCTEAEKDLRATQATVDEARRASEAGLLPADAAAEYGLKVGGGLTTIAGVLKTIGSTRVARLCLLAADRARSEGVWTDEAGLQYITEVGSALSLLLARMRGGALVGIDDLIEHEIATIEPSLLDITEVARGNASDTGEKSANEGDLFDVFLEEAAGLVEQARTVIAEPGLGWVKESMRLFHTLKGSARVAGLGEFGDAMEGAQLALEALHDAVEAGEIPAPELRDSAERGVDIVAVWLDTLRTDREFIDYKFDFAALTELFPAAAVDSRQDAACMSELGVADAPPVVIEAPVHGAPMSPQDGSEDAGAAPTANLADGIGDPDTGMDCARTDAADSSLAAEVMTAGDEVTVQVGDDMALKTEVIQDAVFSFDGMGLDQQACDEDAIVQEPSTEDVDIAALRTSIDAAMLAEVDRADRMGDSELLAVISEEAGEIVPRILEVTTSWAAGLASGEDLVAVRRHVHTLKGGVRTVGMMRLGAALHALEDLLDGYEGREQGLLGDDALANLFAQVVENCHRGIQEAIGRESSSPVTEALDAPDALDALPGSESRSPVIEGIDVVAALESIEAPSAPEAVAQAPGKTRRRAPAGPMMRVAVDAVANISKASGEAAVLQRRTAEEVAGAWRSLKELEAHLERAHGLMKELEIEAEVRIQAGRASGAEGAFDPLEFDRFTRLQEVARSLSENIADITDSANAIGESLARVNDAENLREAVADGIQEEASKLMVAPLASHKARLERVVALACEDAGKEARLRLSGDAEVPGPVMDRLLPALEHILRNAVAHGIESPSQREQIGKPRAGNIDIEASQAGPGLSLAVRDDGAGVDLEKVLAKARTKGIAKAGIDYGAEQVFAMLFAPGFSTSESVSQLSGRGIGLDVVQNTVAEIGGLVKLNSTLGKGATFTISAPTDISTMSVVPVTVGGADFMLPAALVDRLSSVRSEGLHDTVEIAGTQFRLVDFARVAGVQRESGLPAVIGLVLMGCDSTDPVAYAVDAVDVQRKVVVRPLGRHISALPGLVAGTVGGDGSPILIVNPMRMRDLGEAAAEAAKASQVVLLVDDSSTVRLATAKALRRAGFEVVTAKDGIDALEKLQRGLVPHAFALDLEMPRLDGFELTREIRLIEAFRHTPIFIVSSRVAQKHRDHVLALGATDFLGKPVQAQELAERIRRHVAAAVA